MESPVPGQAHGAAPKCGGKNRKGAPCGNSAGYKTDHPGSGNCHFHGGSSPNGRKHAVEQAARQAVITFGLPRDISAVDALMEEVRYTAGHVAWLREQVQALEAGQLVWGMTEQVDKSATEFAGTDTTYGAKASIWLELYYRERKHLVDVTKAAITAGIEERKVRLAEQQGALVAQVIRSILADLELSPGQQARVPEVVPRHLRALAG